MYKAQLPLVHQFALEWMEDFGGFSCNLRLRSPIHIYSDSELFPYAERILYEFTISWSICSFWC